MMTALNIANLHDMKGCISELCRIRLTSQPHYAFLLVPLPSLPGPVILEFCMLLNAPDA